jgi:hypothetical protein
MVELKDGAKVDITGGKYKGFTGTIERVVTNKTVQAYVRLDAPHHSVRLSTDSLTAKANTKTSVPSQDHKSTKVPAEEEETGYTNADTNIRHGRGMWFIPYGTTFDSFKRKGDRNSQLKEGE